MLLPAEGLICHCENDLLNRVFATRDRRATEGPARERFYSLSLLPGVDPADQCVRASRHVCGPPPSAMRPCALPRRPEPKWPPGRCRITGLTPRPYSPEPRLGLVR